jgi:putative transcriptional regulator
MDSGRFEWDTEKAAANWRAHGVTFDHAVKAFRDPFGVEWIDDRESYGKERVDLLGMSDGVLLHVTYAERGDLVRIISARRRRDMKQTIATAKIRPDGTVVEVLSDRSERLLPETPMRPMTEAEIETAAAADPDARPMTQEELGAARRVPRIKTLRRALALTQEEFAARYQIPVGTLRDWEQGRTEPDQPARAYLKVIARDPETVRRILDEERPAPLRS